MLPNYEMCLVIFYLTQFKNLFALQMRFCGTSPIGEIKKLYSLFLWTGFNCLKATEPLRGDSSLFTISPQKFLVLI